MRRYEQICILHPSLSEDQVNTVIENSHQVIQDEAGTIITTDKWGMKKLAYPIQKEQQGYYVFCDFAATPAAVAEVERKFRIDDAVLKYLTVKLSDTISAEEITTAQNEAVARAEKVAAEAAAKAEAEAESAEVSEEENDKGEE